MGNLVLKAPTFTHCDLFHYFVPLSAKKKRKKREKKEKRKERKVNFAD
jgi:hypothetical protein